LGGRLDSTNICQPVITVITTIGLDHVRQLGGTLPAIAREKAGIIKPGVPVISGVVQAEPQAVIRQVAAERDAPTCFLDEDFSFDYHAPAGVDLSEDAVGLLDFHRHGANPAPLAGVRLRLLGRHQAANAAAALATLWQLRADGWGLPERALRQGLEDVRCRGRVEILSRRPTIVLDTAHNDSSIEALLATLDQSFSARRRVLIFATTREKDVTGMLRRLLPNFGDIILTRYVENPRGVSPAELKTTIDQILPRDLSGAKPTVTVCDTPLAAWRHCESIMTPEHLVCIAGSFFLAAEIRPLISTSPARHELS
jgi:dihydrofolate synthase/folylpolyglutamate synthase